MEQAEDTLKIRPLDADNDAPRGRVFSLDNGTLVPLGLLVAVVLSAISATVWLNTRLLTLEHAVAALMEKLSELRDQVGNGTSDRWTATDMRRWIELSNVSNPTLKLPPPGR